MVHFSRSDVEKVCCTYVDLMNTRRLMLLFLSEIWLSA